jgi:predicted nuclease with RNAse H fold
VHYCGVVAVGGLLQLAMLEEVRASEPPIRLSAIFYEPGEAERVAAELQSLDEVVVALDGPVGEPRDHAGPRTCDSLLKRRGVAPKGPDPSIRRVASLLGDLGRFEAADDGLEGPVPEGAYRDSPVFETNADGVFCAMQGRRLPAKRHPLGIRRRIEELEQDHLVDEGGELWHRRIEELDAAAAALCAHRYAVGHACWLGDPDEDVVVLPGSSLPEEFASAGVLPPVERLTLPRA